MSAFHPTWPRVFAAVVLAALAGAPARADFINGGFENGFTGWTRVVQLGSEGNFFLQSGTGSPVLGLPVPPPPAGTFAAMTDAAGPGSRVLYQDFVVPNGAFGGQIQFDLFVGNRDTNFFVPAAATGLNFATPALNQQARVDILRPGADPFSVAAADVLLNLYQTRPGDPLVAGYFPVSADVSGLFAAYSGQTLRFRVAQVDNVAPFQFGIDRVTVAAVPEPATAALLGVGVTAAFGLARCRAARRRAG